MLNLDLIEAVNNIAKAIRARESAESDQMLIKRSNKLQDAWNHLSRLIDMEIQAIVLNTENRVKAEVYKTMELNESFGKLKTEKTTETEKPVNKEVGEQE